MRWTYDGTIRNVLWIGGAQWAGKTTVAAILTSRYGLTHYHCDYHDSRAHEDRRNAARARQGQPPQRATALGIRVIEVDGTENAESIADEVADHFSAVMTA
ncbi:hypothetical protein [Polymorphospora lycopeni]|uniref:Uncharacterized protein n=1 Tax=Polymorphospora lycopeni TaxID=3140240 RepID=A0ABV5D090_9ACTN